MTSLPSRLAYLEAMLTWYLHRDLRRSLVQLHAYSTGTTRRLDETYYAVLEKTAALQMTFGALRDLAASSGDLAGEFDRGAKGLEDDIRAQLRGLGTFEEQEERIRGLQARIETGRTRMHDLVARVDGVRNRVERWEKADHEWQAKMRRRLRVIWGLVLVVILVVMGLVVSVNGLSSASSGDAVSSSAMSPDAGVPHRILRHDALNISRLVPILDEPPATTDKLFRSTPRPTDDNRLRQFDEL